MNAFMPSPLCAAALCYHPNIKEIRYFDEHSL